MLVVAGLAVLVGALVQGVVGFGLAVVVAPVLAILDPSLVPGTILLVTAALPALALWRERGEVDWRGLRWALLGRLPGTAAGTWLVTRLPPEGLAVAVGVVVLGAVVTSVLRWRPSITPRTLLAAGFVSGVAGTATSVGGPPMALLYQEVPGPRVRATLSAFFLVGILVLLAALLAAGALAMREVGVAALLLPSLTVGFWASGPLRAHVDAGRVRPAVLVLCTVSAVVLLGRTLLA